MSCTPLPNAAKPVWFKQRTRLPCLVVYVKFNLCILLKAKWAVSFFFGFHQFSRPTVTGIWKSIQWMLWSKQRFRHSRVCPTCYLSSWGEKYTTLRGYSGKLFGFSIGGPTDELHPFYRKHQYRFGLNNWLDCLASWHTSNLICVFTTNSKMGSQLLLDFTSPHIQLWRGSEKAFIECFGVSNAFATAAYVQPVTYHHEVTSIPLGEVNREICSVSA